MIDQLYFSASPSRTIFRPADFRPRARNAFAGNADEYTDDRTRYGADVGHGRRRAQAGDYLLTEAHPGPTVQEWAYTLRARLTSGNVLL